MLTTCGFGRIACATLLAAMLCPRAVIAADANNGARLAHRWCEACHVIAEVQSRASTDAAPPFATIAARPDFNASAIAMFLLDPHAKMPNMSLTRTEAADLAAYIGSLAH